MSKLLTTLLTIATFLFTLWVVTACVGCSYNTSREKLTCSQNAQDAVVYESEISQGLLLYFTKTKQIDHRGPLSSLSVGGIESFPDPNSIEAGVKGVVSGVIGVRP